MEENVQQRKSVGSGNTHFLAAVNSLLDSISEKDEAVRNAIELALGRMAERKPNETMTALYEFKSKQHKLPETQTAIVLRIVEKYTLLNTNKLNDETLKIVIELVIGEITKSQDHCPALQKPGLEALVSIGRIYCDKVMDGLVAQLQQGQPTHFMVLNTMGTLATANINGIIGYIKPTLVTILPTLGSIKLDHIKQAYAFAIGRFAEAITEYNTQQKTDSNATENFETEIAIAYDVVIHQWLPNREPKVAADMLQALAHMYPILPPDNITDQVVKVITQLLGFYRRSMDRNAITQLLASVVKTSIDTDHTSLDPISDTLVASLFDLVCVNPDYEKPQTVKGHYEVLRCFDLLLEIYSTKIFDMLLVQLRSNNDRERVKSLLVLTHLTNTYDHLIRPRTGEFLALLKQMISTEKTCKIKMVLLKTIVALAQKSLIPDADFIRFILRHCCPLARPNHEFGTTEEQLDLMQACNNSLYILATTVLTMDEILKQELLQAYLIIDHTTVANTITKCLAKIFARRPELSTPVNEQSPELTTTPTALQMPNAESIFVRSLILMGNTNEYKRTENILQFLKVYCPVLNKHLRPVWLERIPELTQLIQQSDVFGDKLFQFVSDTIKDMDDFNFADALVNKLSHQLSLYPQLPLSVASEYVVPNQQQERGQLLKLLGLCLCYVFDQPTIESMIDLIMITARQERLDKSTPNSEYESRLSDGCKALGYVARVHLDTVLRKLSQLVQEEGSRRSTGNFFSGLNFMKDAGKEAEMYKINLLAIESYQRIVQMAPASAVLKDIDARMVNYLCRQFDEAKDNNLRRMALNTLLTVAEQIERTGEIDCPMQSRSGLLTQLYRVDASMENLSLLPTILRLATVLIRIGGPGASVIDDQYQIEVHEFFAESSRKFFTTAQQLKTKFESAEEDERNSYLAKYLNLSLPELNQFVRTIFEQSPSPAALDDVHGVVEFWLKNRNSEVRICAGHVMNHALGVYIKTAKIGCEAPAKFNQAGSMCAGIVPRCIDSNATVRQTSVEILQKILEICCIYESLTIADENADWVKDLQQIQRDIITDDPKEIYKITGELARIIAMRLSNFQYLQFSKSLLYCLNDTEQSSAYGSSVVLMFFIQIKGAELFHAIPEFVKESLHALSTCTSSRARQGVLKALVALTKHHPKLVCSEMLSQSLPFELSVKEYWQILAIDPDLCGTILDNFLNVLSSSCLYESTDGSDRQNIATTQPFAIHCVLHEMLPCKEIKTELQKRFPEIFSMLLTSLATYTNLAPPMLAQKPSSIVAKNEKNKSKFGFVPNKEAIKMNPCLVVLQTFQVLLANLEMEQVGAVLSVCPHLASSTELSNFMELLTPMAVGLVNQLGINSGQLSQTVTVLSRYVSSPYDPQRIAAVGLYSQLIPLKPSGEIASVIMLHLNSALTDPNPLVRGFCIRGLAYVGELSPHDIDKYSEISLTALLKGVDDFNAGCIINVPLESMLGLSRIMISLPRDKLENFQVSLAVRIRPFFENSSAEIREAAVLLFGDLCQSKMSATPAASFSADDSGPIEDGHVSDALREQLFANFFSMLLHLSEMDAQIVRACKVTLRKVCAIINAPKVNSMVQSHLLDHGQLHYDIFIADLLKLIGEELPENIPDFIESCLPFLKSSWPEIRGNAAVIIGLLYNLNKNNQHIAENVGQKLAILLRDEQIPVRVKASHALGYMFGELL